MVGVHAAQLAAEGKAGVSVNLVRKSTIGPNEAYECVAEHQPLEAVAAKTRHLPESYIKGHSDVSQAFLDYVTPLLGALPPFELLE